MQYCVIYNLPQINSVVRCQLGYLLLNILIFNNLLFSNNKLLSTLDCNMKNCTKNMLKVGLALLGISSSLGYIYSILENDIPEIYHSEETTEIAKELSKYYYYYYYY